VVLVTERLKRGTVSSRMSVFPEIFGVALGGWRGTENELNHEFDKD